MTFPFASLTAWLALAAYAGLSWHFLAHAHGWSIPWRRALNIEHLLVAAALALHFLALLPANAHGLAFGLGQSLSTVMWLTVLIYWTASFLQARRPANLPDADGGAGRGAGAGVAAGLSGL